MYHFNCEGQAKNTGGNESKVLTVNTSVTYFADVKIQLLKYNSLQPFMMTFRKIDKFTLLTPITKDTAGRK